MPSDAGYLILLLTVSSLWSLSHAENRDSLCKRAFEIKDLPFARRTKRALFSGITNFIKGEQATKKLLKGTVHFNSRMKSREHYLKHGDYRTALDDFFSVKPSNVHDIVTPDRVIGKVGSVGDLEITVQTWVDHGTTSIIITKGFGTNKEMSKYIAYQMEQSAWALGQ